MEEISVVEFLKIVNSDSVPYPYFGVGIKKKTNLLICREKYAEIDKRNHCNNEEYMLRRYPKDVLKKYYEDDECKIHTDEWCQKHREDCLKNYDLNMAYMESLSKADFEKELTRFLKKHKKIKQISNLNDCDNVEGIYILVLDKYKQVYIGQARNIKRRIMSHWSKTKPFDKLLFGSVERSILSIDSFGALDTTRIYILPTQNAFSIEKELVSDFSLKYMLNRTGGGIGDDKETYQFEIIANAKTRDLG